MFKSLLKWLCGKSSAASAKGSCSCGCGSGKGAAERVATIADLEGLETIGLEQFTEALCYRFPEERYGGQIWD